MSTLFNLSPDQKVKVKEGFGLVPVAADTEDTIAFAGKKYAITASGILLTRNDRYGVIEYQGPKTTGFNISAKARRLQGALLLPLEAPYLPRGTTLNQTERGFLQAYLDELEDCGLGEGLDLL